MRRLYWIAILIVMVTLSSCRSSFEPVATIDVETDSRLSAVGRFDALAGSYKDWSSVTMPFRLQLETPESKSISGKATMVRDKCVQLSFRAVGMEVAYVHITADSVFAIDKMNKLCIAAPLSDVVGTSGMTIGNLQDLFLGQAFIMGKERLSQSARQDIRIETDSAAWAIVPNADMSDLVYYYSVYNADVLKSLTVVSANGGIECAYSIPTEGNAGVVAQKTTFTGEYKGNAFNASLLWNAKNAEWNTITMVKKRKMPKSYERIEIDRLIYIISSIEEDAEK